MDHQIANIDKESFLFEMIQMATDEGMILHMHQGLISPCDNPNEDDDDD